MLVNSLGLPDAISKGRVKQRRGARDPGGRDKHRIHQECSTNWMTSAKWGDFVKAMHKMVSERTQ